MKIKMVKCFLCAAIPFGVMAAAQDDSNDTTKITEVELTAPPIDTSSQSNDIDAKAMVELTQLMTTYQATYEQKITDQFGNVKDRSKGQFVLKKPYQFIWETREPYEQKIVSDGTDLWTYDLDLEQVNVQTLDKALGSTPAFLIGSDVELLSKSFTIKRLPSGSQDVDTFELTPKDLGQAFERLLLLFKDKQLVELFMFDTLGQRTIINFFDVEMNQELIIDTFKFVVPEDVDLVDSRQTTTANG